MTHPSESVQQALCAALLQLLKSPDLTPKDAKWLRQFALRTVAEFNALRSTRKDRTPRKPLAA